MSPSHEAAVGPIFTNAGDAEDPVIIDITQIVELWVDKEEEEYPFSCLFRNSQQGKYNQETGEKIAEAMLKLNPKCNYCGQGTMHCDHCGAPL